MLEAVTQAPPAPIHPKVIIIVGRTLHPKVVVIVIVRTLLPRAKFIVVRTLLPRVEFIIVISLYPERAHLRAVVIIARHLRVSVIVTLERIVSVPAHLWAIAITAAATTPPLYLYPRIAIVNTLHPRAIRILPRVSIIITLKRIVLAPAHLWVIAIAAVTTTRLYPRVVVIVNALHPRAINILLAPSHPRQRSRPRPRPKVVLTRELW